MLNIPPVPSLLAKPSLTGEGDPLRSAEKEKVDFPRFLEKSKDLNVIPRMAGVIREKPLFTRHALFIAYRLFIKTPLSQPKKL